MSRGTVDDHHPLDGGPLEPIGTELGGKRGLAERDPRARVLQEEVERVLICLGVQKHRHEAGAHRAEEGGRVDRRVVEEERDPLAAPQTGALKARPQRAASAISSR